MLKSPMGHWIWTRLLGEGRVIGKAPILFILTALIIGGLGIYGAYKLLEVRYQDRLQTKDEQIRLLSLRGERVTTDVQVTTQKSGGPPELVQTEPTELVLQFPGGTNPPKQLSAKNSFRWYSLVNSVQVNLITPEEHEPREYHIVNIVWLFDKPTTYIQPDVSFSSPNLPEYEIKDHSLRSLIVSFKGRLPAGVLTLSLRQ